MKIDNNVLAIIGVIIIILLLKGCNTTQNQSVYSGPGYYNPNPQQPQSTPTPAPHEQASNCGDGTDNDADGLIDCFDPDCNCLGGYSCEIYSVNPQCGGSCPGTKACTPHGSICSCVDTLSCYDSDGNDPKNTGYLIINGDGVKHNDRCLNGNTVIEGLCAGNLPSEMPVDCSQYNTLTTWWCCDTVYAMDGTTSAKCSICD